MQAKEAKVSGAWTAFRSPRSGKERFVWRRNADAGKLKRQQAKGGAKEGAAEEVMNKIRKMANKRKGMDLKAAFIKFDVNNDGTIEPQELDQVLRSFGIELEAFELDAVFSRFDPDGGGAIDYSEFSYTFYNRRAIAKAAQSGGKIKMPGATDGTKQKSIDGPRSMGISQSAPSLKRGGGGGNGASDDGMLGSTGTLMPTVKLATSSEMLASKIVRALTPSPASCICLRWLATCSIVNPASCVFVSTLAWGCCRFADSRSDMSGENGTVLGGGGGESQ